MTAKNNKQAFDEWIKFTYDHYGWDYDFASNQWNLYWEGIRDARIYNETIWLIKKYGY